MGALQELPALQKHRAFWVRADVGRMGLHKIWLNIETGFLFVIAGRLFMRPSGAFAHFQRYVTSYPV